MREGFVTPSRNRSLFRRVRNSEPDVHHRCADRLAQPQRLGGREECLRPRFVPDGRLDANAKDIPRRRIDEVTERDVHHPLRRAVVESVVTIDALALAHTLARPSGRLRRCSLRSKLLRCIRKTCRHFARSSNASFTVCASVQSKVGKVGFGPSRLPTVFCAAKVQKMPPSAAPDAGCSSILIAHPVPLAFAW